MELTERDRALLRHLAAARWLTTRQVAALVFTGVSHSMVCRRLRMLRRGRFVRAVRENSMAEALHTLGARGREALGELGWGRRIALERSPPANRPHFTGINDIRIAVLRSVHREGAHLDFFFASWELAERGWPYHVMPDAACAVSLDGKSATALFEYDRGTEGTAYVIERKLKRYAAGLEGFPFSRVIIVVVTARRLERLSREAALHAKDQRFTFLARDALPGWSVRDLWDRDGSGRGSREGSGA